jgi:hypothetical protein
VRTYVFLLLAFCAIGTSPLSRAQNLLRNGSFEFPGLPPGENQRFLTNGNTYVSGWTVIDDGVGQPPFYGNTELNDAVFSGEYGLVLNQGSGVRTTFRAEVGEFYEVSLWVRPDDCPGCSTPAPMRVSVGGNVVSLPVEEGWTRQKIDFQASRSLNVLELFNPASPSDYKRYTIDDVVIQKLTGAILSARLMPVVTIEGTVGARYQIQSATSLTAPLWTTLTNLTLSNNPTLFIDTSNLGRFRIYRAVRVP